MNSMRGMKSSWIGRTLVSVVIVAVAASGLGGCETNPTTGRKQAITLSWDQEVALGLQEGPKVAQEFGGEVAKKELRDYVTEIGLKVAATTSQDDARLAGLPWKFTLLNSDVVNAFALPGGQVFVTRALAERMTNEAQLAGVLGHEIGHVAARHTNERIAQTQWAQLGVGALGVVGGADYGQLAAEVAGQGAQFWLLSYSRDQESEADALGMRYMTRAMYNPIGQRQVMEILKGLDKGGRQPEFFSTHPYPEKRIENIDGALKGEYAHTQNNPQYTLRDAEFRSRFLSKLSAAFPEGYDTSEEMVRLASTGRTGESRH